MGGLGNGALNTTMITQSRNIVRLYVGFVSVVDHRVKMEDLRIRKPVFVTVNIRGPAGTVQSAVSNVNTVNLTHRIVPVTVSPAGWEKLAQIIVEILINYVTMAGT